MRSKILTVMTLILLTLIVVGCGGDDKKDSDNNSNPLGPGGDNGGSVAQGGITATISGALTMDLTLAGGIGSYSQSENWVGISGAAKIDNVDYTFMIEVSTTSTGTYNITEILKTKDNEGYGLFMMMASQQNMSTYNSTSGTINITQVTPNLKGTFSMEASNGLTGETIQLSNGQFNVPAMNADK